MTVDTHSASPGSLYRSGPVVRVPGAPAAPGHTLWRESMAPRRALLRKRPHAHCSATNPQLAADLEAQRRDKQKRVNRILPVYPVIAAGASYRF